MRRMKNNERYDKFERILERTISFANFCDTKASIIMTMLGVIITVLSTVFVRDVMSIIEQHELIKSDLLLYFMFAGLSILFILSSMIMLIIVLFARTKNKEESLIFFEKISKKELDDYANEMKRVSDEELTEDLIKQIYANSKICNKKFKFFNIALILCIIGILCIVTDIIIRLFFV